MVIMTAKVSKRKMLLVLLLLVLAAAVLITCLKRADTPDTSQDTAEEIAEVATNEARVAFLEQFGWTVAEEPVQTQKVRVPEDPSEVFLRYTICSCRRATIFFPTAAKPLRATSIRSQTIPAATACILRRFLSTTTASSEAMWPPAARTA